MTAELLPCPFCGGEAGYYASNEAVFGASWIGHVCHCKVCQGRVQTTAGMDASVAMWNARAAIQPQEMWKPLADAATEVCRAVEQTHDHVQWFPALADLMKAVRSLTRPELCPAEKTDGSQS